MERIFFTRFLMIVGVLFILTGCGSSNNGAPSASSDNGETNAVADVSIGNNGTSPVADIPSDNNETDPVTDDNGALPTPDEGGLNTKLRLVWGARPEADIVSTYEVYFAKSENTADATQLLKTIFVSSSEFDPENPMALFDADKDLGLNKGDSVCFRIKARNAAGASDFSDGVCRQMPL